jgi:hypothetical protein
MPPGGVCGQGDTGCESRQSAAATTITTETPPWQHQRHAGRTPTGGQLPTGPPAGPQ